MELKKTDGTYIYFAVVLLNRRHIDIFQNGILRMLYYNLLW